MFQFVFHYVKNNKIYTYTIDERWFYVVTAVTTVTITKITLHLCSKQINRLVRRFDVKRRDGRIIFPDGTTIRPEDIKEIPGSNCEVIVSSNFKNSPSKRLELSQKVRKMALVLTVLGLSTKIRIELTKKKIIDFPVEAVTYCLMSLKNE